MNGAIVNNVVVKPGRIPKFYEWLQPELRPTSFKQYADAYTYQYVEGRRAEAQDAERILATCRESMWFTDHDYLSAAEVDAYCEYVTVLRVNYAHRLTSRAIVADAIKLLRAAKLPRALFVHGDLTLENVVVRPDGVITFIDPGNDRGARTPGVDRGKLLQSVVMRWEERDRLLKSISPWSQPAAWPAWADEIDWAFLVTHWVRLLRHWPNHDLERGLEAIKWLRP